MLKTLLRRLSPFLIILLFIVLAAALMATKKEPEKKPDAQPLSLVDAREATPAKVSLDLPSYGVVNPKHKTQLVAEVNGRILTIAPEFVTGGMVVKGQQLAMIEPSDYQADLAQAEANLAQARAALEEEIARGEVAKIEFRDFDSGVAPQLGLRKPQLQKEQANVAYAEAALDRAKRNLQRTVIRAPFDGLVRTRNADLGQYVTLGTQLGELYSTDTAEIRLPIANGDLAYLESLERPDTRVALSTDLAGQKVSWDGQIIRSEGVIDPDNRMVYLVAQIHDPYRRQPDAAQGLPLKFGTFVNAVIRGKTLENIVKLPRHLVRNGKVMLVTADNRIEIRPVNVVRTDMEHIYIQDSIRPGERISYTTSTNLNNGQQVAIVGEKDHSGMQDAPIQPSGHLAAAEPQE